MKKEALYQQLNNILKDRIIKGIYPVGSFLPTELQLEEEFKHSKITIRKAVELLSQEGYVEKKAGLGTKIIQNKKNVVLQKGQKFTEILMENGFTIEKKVNLIDIYSTEPDSKERELFGNNCFRLIREITINKKPYIYSYHYFPLFLNLPIDRNYYEESLYSILNKLGFSLNNFEDYLFADISNSDVKEFLKEEVVLGRKRFSYSDDKLIEFSIAYYNTKEHEYVIKLNESMI